MEGPGRREYRHVQDRQQLLALGLLPYLLDQLPRQRAIGVEAHGHCHAADAGHDRLASVAGPVICGPAHAPTSASQLDTVAGKAVQRTTAVSAGGLSYQVPSADSISGSAGDIAAPGRAGQQVDEHHGLTCTQASVTWGGILAFAAHWEQRWHRSAGRARDTHDRGYLACWIWRRLVRAWCRFRMRSCLAALCPRSHTAASSPLAGSPAQGSGRLHALLLQRCYATATQALCVHAACP